jgi:carbon monoxide dehydrogenase subunit G
VQLVNEFVVPGGVDETWAVLTDVARIVPAMPGAALTGVEDGNYHGTVKIKVGPVTAAYAGVASFRELDQTNHHMTLHATGKESSGRGRATATVTADLSPDGSHTRVTVTTNLTISGPLAQFGRGAIAEVSTRLLNQFVANLKETVLADGSPSPAPSSGSTTSAPSSGSTTSAPAAAAVASSPADAAAASAPADAAAASSPAAAAAAVGPTTAPPTPPAPQAPPAAPAAAEVNLLGVAAWPILKRVIPVIIVVAVIVVLIVRLT